MPWMPELFSAPALERVMERRRREELAAVPYFAGLMAGETGALVRSFAGEPELHHPVRGRVKGARAFEAFVAQTNEWLAERNASVEDVDLVLTQAAAWRKRSCASTARTAPSSCPRRSSRTASRTGGCASYASTSASGR